MKKSFLAVMLLGLLLLAGCGKQDSVDTNTIQVNKDGSISGVLVEDFSQSYYNLEELEKMISDEITKYNNTAGADSVTLGSVEMKDDNTVKLSMKYTAASNYEGFNQKTLFIGTVSEAKASGYAFVTMNSANDGEALSEAQVLEKGDSNIVITEEKGNIVVPGKIAYISENVTSVDKKTATVNEDEVAYIIYE